MQVIRAAILGWLTISGTAAAQGQEAPGICDWVLQKYAVSMTLGENKNSAPNSAKDFIRKNTTFLDFMFGYAGAGDMNAPYRDFYVIDGNPPRQKTDFFTKSAKRHSDGRHSVGCIQVDGTLGAEGNGDEKTPRTTLVFDGRDMAPVPVSVFAFASENSAFWNEARSQTATEKTNVRVKVGELIIEPGGPDQQVPVDEAHPFEAFYFSTYISQNQSQTLVGSANADGTLNSVGEHLWFGADIGQGPQLVVVVCSPHCGNYLNRANERMPRFVPAEQAVVADTFEKYVPQVQPTDFAGEILEIPPPQYGGITAYVDLEAKTREFSAPTRAVVQGFIGELADNTEGKADEAIKGLIDAGILQPFDLEQWAVQDYELRHVVTLRRKGPERLTGVWLELEKPQGAKVLGSCVPQVEISHDYHETLRLDTEIDVNSGIGGGQYTRFILTLDNADYPILQEPLETLRVNVVVTENVSGKDTTCRLEWNGFFPLSSFSLEESPNAPPSDYFTLDPDGVAEFSNVVLTSTQPFVYLLYYNVKGPRDSNGQPTAPHEYPEWNGEAGGEDLREAFGILTNVAHTAFARGSGGIYTVFADGGASKAFGSARALVPARVRSPNIPLPEGRVGAGSLQFAMDEAAKSNNADPHFVVIGRSGLPEGADYCERPRAGPAGAAENTILIDFAPKAFYEGLSDDKKRAIDDPQGSDALRNAVKGFPAVRCPNDGQDGPEHWVLFPDYKSRFSWRDDLRTLARVIFEESS